METDAPKESNVESHIPSSPDGADTKTSTTNEPPAPDAKTDSGAPAKSKTKVITDFIVEEKKVFWINNFDQLRKIEVILSLLSSFLD